MPCVDVDARFHPELHNPIPSWTINVRHNYDSIRGYKYELRNDIAGDVKLISYCSTKRSRFTKLSTETTTLPRKDRLIVPINTDCMLTQTDTQTTTPHACSLNGSPKPNALLAAGGRVSCPVHHYCTVFYHFHVLSRVFRDPHLYAFTFLSMGFFGFVACLSWFGWVEIMVLLSSLRSSLHVSLFIDASDPQIAPEMGFFGWDPECGMMHKGSDGLLHIKWCQFWPHGLTGFVPTPMCALTSKCGTLLRRNFDVFITAESCQYAITSWWGFIFQ